jgi:hypothetical protein
MLAAAVTLYPPWQRRGFNKWGPREVTTFISGDTPDSIANLVTPPQRHYQSVYRTLPLLLSVCVWRPVSLSPHMPRIRVHAYVRAQSARFLPGSIPKEMEQ